MNWDTIQGLYKAVHDAPTRKDGLAIIANTNLLSLSRAERNAVLSGFFTTPNNKFPQETKETTDA
jgi:hypothetical protein